MASLRLSRFLPYRLSVTAARASDGLARLYSEQFDLNIQQWRVIAVLGEKGTLFAEEICRVTEMDKVSVSRALAALEGQGRVIRTRDKQDGRRARVRLSPKGKRVYNQIVPMALEYEKALLQVLSADEVHKLDELLEKLDLACQD